MQLMCWEYRGGSSSCFRAISVGHQANELAEGIWAGGQALVQACREETVWSGLGSTSPGGRWEEKSGYVGNRGIKEEPPSQAKELVLLRDV